MESLIQFLVDNPMILYAIIAFIICVIIGFFGDKYLTKQKSIEKMLKEEEFKKSSEDSELENLEVQESATLMTSENINDLSQTQTQTTMNSNQNPSVDFMDFNARQQPQPNTNMFDNGVATRSEVNVQSQNQNVFNNEPTQSMNAFDNPNQSFVQNDVLSNGVQQNDLGVNQGMQTSSFEFPAQNVVSNEVPSTNPFSNPMNNGSEVNNSFNNTPFEMAREISPEVYPSENKPQDINQSTFMDQNNLNNNNNMF